MYRFWRGADIFVGQVIRGALSMVGGAISARADALGPARGARDELGRPRSPATRCLRHFITGFCSGAVIRNGLWKSSEAVSRANLPIETSDAK